MNNAPRAALFGRVITAMVTPFLEDGSVDADGAATLADYLVSHGSDALLLTGSTGESSVLADDERIAIWDAVCRAVNVPVLVGSTSNDTAHSVELTKRASKLPVAGILAVTPYYNRPHQGGLEQHFRAVANATSLPVILYDIPIRTGRRIAIETTLHLADEVENIVALKDASGDPATTARLLARTPDDFECYSGDDALTLSLLAIGAVGLISVASHWCGPEFKEMIDCFFAGDVEGAIAINRVLIDSYVFQTSDDGPNPLPLKAMLRTLGLPAGQCRLPLGHAPDGLGERAKTVLAELETWRKVRRAHG